MSEVQKKGGWTWPSWIVLAWNWTLRYPLALIVAVGVIALAIVLAASGFGEGFNAGGILGWLFGRDEADKEPGVEVKVNRIPEERKDDQGEVIPIGEPDQEGFVQREVTVIDRKRNPFRDKNVLEVQTPEGAKKKLRLPTGIKDTDVDTVVLTKPGEVEIRVIEMPKRASDALLDALE